MFSVNVCVRDAPLPHVDALSCGVLLQAMLAPVQSRITSGGIRGHPVVGRFTASAWAGQLGAVPGALVGSHEGLGGAAGPLVAVGGSGGGGGGGGGSTGGVFGGVEVGVGRAVAPTPLPLAFPGSAPRDVPASACDVDPVHMHMHTIDESL